MTRSWLPWFYAGIIIGAVLVISPIILALAVYLVRFIKIMSEDLYAAWVRQARVEKRGGEE